MYIVRRELHVKSLDATSVSFGYNKQMNKHTNNYLLLLLSTLSQPAKPLQQDIEGRSGVLEEKHMPPCQQLHT